MNEMRISEMIRLARFEHGRGRKPLEICKYYKSDYIAIQMIRTFFLTTVAFFLILFLCAAGSINWLLSRIETMNLLAAGSWILIAYIITISFYLGLTFILSGRRYNNARRSVHAYGTRLHELGRNLPAEAEYPERNHIRRTRR
jgi:hypothetical protein